MGIWDHGVDHIDAEPPTGGKIVAARWNAIMDYIQTLLTAVTGTAPIVVTGTTAPVISITAASTAAPGSMSAADKTKLDGIAAGAQPGTVTAVTGTAPIASSGGTTPAISITAASGSGAGSMSSADFTKLSGIEAGADVTDATNVNAAGALMSDTFAPNFTRDILAGSMKVPDSNPASYRTVILPNGIPEIIVGFVDTDSLPEAYARIPMPIGWNGGNLTLVANWMTTSATLGAVKLDFSMIRVGDGENANIALNATSVITSITDTNTGSYYENQSAETATFTLTGSGKNIALLVKRDNTVASNLAAEIWLTGLRLKGVGDANY